MSLLKKHIKHGCLSDPPDVVLYYRVEGRDEVCIRAGALSFPAQYKESGLCAQVMCFRGTNQLEGWHQHYKRGFGYNHASAELAKALLMDMAHNWTLKTGIAHRGDPDFGTFEYHRLEKVFNPRSMRGLPGSSQHAHPMQIRVMAGKIHPKYADVLFPGLVHVSDFRCTRERFVYLGNDHIKSVEERLATVVERQLSPGVQRLVDSTADIENETASQHDSSTPDLEGVWRRQHA